jgi:hypothetical protein
MYQLLHVSAPRCQSRWVFIKTEDYIYINASKYAPLRYRWLGEGESGNNQAGSKSNRIVPASWQIDKK